MSTANSDTPAKFLAVKPWGVSEEFSLLSDKCSISKYLNDDVVWV